nr:hypothetical protein [Mycobacterium sp. UM_NZ2]
MTIEDIRGRLVELQAERTLGEERLALLDRQRDELRAVLLRIDGAVQVLEELTAASAADEPVAEAGAAAGG